MGITWDPCQHPGRCPEHTKLRTGYIHKIFPGVYSVDYDSYSDKCLCRFIRLSTLCSSVELAERTSEGLHKGHLGYVLKRHNRHMPIR
jgi:hypothetical protein